MACRELDKSNPADAFMVVEGSLARTEENGEVLFEMQFSQQKHSDN